MENLKIKVNSEAESIEVQELFFELGCKRYGGGEKQCNWIVVFDDGDMCLDIYDNTNHKEITIQELKDMVVLKRNDSGDATHEDSNKYNWFVASDQKHYRFQGEIWVYQPYVDCLDLKQIQKQSIIDKLVDLPEFKHDFVNHPSHYCSHPSGIECIEITRHHDFAIGNAIKYLWRAGLKDSDNEIQDLEKAIFYIQDKITQLKNK